MTAKPCKVVTDWLLRATDLEKNEFIDFFIHFNTYFNWSAFPR